MQITLSHGKPRRRLNYYRSMRSGQLIISRRVVSSGMELTGTLTVTFKGDDDDKITTSTRRSTLDHRLRASPRASPSFSLTCSALLLPRSGTRCVRGIQRATGTRARCKKERDPSEEANVEIILLSCKMGEGKNRFLGYPLRFSGMDERTLFRRRRAIWYSLVVSWSLTIIMI